MKLPFFTGGINDVQEGVFFIRQQMLLCLFYRKPEGTWGDSGAIKDESKIHSARKASTWKRKRTSIAYYGIFKVVFDIKCTNFSFSRRHPRIYAEAGQPQLIQSFFFCRSQWGSSFSDPESPDFTTGLEIILLLVFFIAALTVSNNKSNVF
jgi:hypothetical protein